MIDDFGIHLISAAYLSNKGEHLTLLFSRKYSRNGGVAMNSRSQGSPLTQCDTPCSNTGRSSIRRRLYKFILALCAVCVTATPINRAEGDLGTAMLFGGSFILSFARQHLLDSLRGADPQTELLRMTQEQLEQIYSQLSVTVEQNIRIQENLHAILTRFDELDVKLDLKLAQQTDNEAAQNYLATIKQAIGEVYHARDGAKPFGRQYATWDDIEGRLSRLMLPSVDVTTALPAVLAGWHHHAGYAKALGVDAQQARALEEQYRTYVDSALDMIKEHRAALWDKTTDDLRTIEEDLVRHAGQYVEYFPFYSPGQRRRHRAFEKDWKNVKRTPYRLAWLQENAPPDCRPIRACVTHDGEVWMGRDVFWSGFGRVWVAKTSKELVGKKFNPSCKGLMSDYNVDVRISRGWCEWRHMKNVDTEALGLYKTANALRSEIQEIEATIALIALLDDYIFAAEIALTPPEPPFDLSWSWDRTVKETITEKEWEDKWLVKILDGTLTRQEFMESGVPLGLFSELLATSNRDRLWVPNPVRSQTSLKACADWGLTVRDLRRCSNSLIGSISEWGKEVKAYAWWHELSCDRHIVKGPRNRSALRRLRDWFIELVSRPYDYVVLRNVEGPGQACEDRAGWALRARVKELNRNMLPATGVGADVWRER